MKNSAHPLPRIVRTRERLSNQGLTVDFRILDRMARKDEATELTGPQPVGTGRQDMRRIRLYQVRKTLITRNGPLRDRCDQALLPTSVELAQYYHHYSINSF